MFFYVDILLITFALSQTEIGISDSPVIDFAIESNLNQLDYPNVCGIYQDIEGLGYENVSSRNGYSGRSIYLFPGWPIEVAGFQERGAIYCNMDSDSAMEIISNSGNKVYPWNLDGSLVGGWPQSLNLHAYGAPALGDVDGDGVDEIVVGTMMGGTGKSGWLYVFEKDGSTVSGLLPGQEASIVIRDLSGRVIQTINKELIGAENSVKGVWNGTDFSENQVPSGIYSVTVCVENEITAAKMITLLR